MANYLEELLLRVVALEKEAISITNGAASNSDAVPYFFFWQEPFPYWTNRISAEETVYASEDDKRRIYTVTMRYVVGHLTEGQSGAPESRLYADIPLIEDYFDARIGLYSSPNYLSDLRYLDATDCTFEGSNGLRIFESAGIPARQIGTEFTLTAPFHIRVTQIDWS